MQRRKTAVDARIAAATAERGVLLVLTGNGKGKSSSAFGMVARALGHDMHVGVVQFIKGRYSTGEEMFFRRFPQVIYHVMGEGFTWETQDRERDVRAAQAAWVVAAALLRDTQVEMVVLDELNIALRYRYVSVDDVIDRAAREAHATACRDHRARRARRADRARRHRDRHALVKHAFDAGVRAQPGVEL